MPILFISYKRGTAAIQPLMERLTGAHYRLWYDKDDIHAGENWREAIKQGVDHCDALIIGLTPAACRSKFVRYEVQRGKEQGKLLFPVKLEALNESEDPQLLGLEDIQFIDFTIAESGGWDKAVQKLLADMVRHEALRVTHHDLRRQRGSTEHVLHQRYLKRLADRVGSLNLARISPEEGGMVNLESVYIDSPTELQISVAVQDWHVVDWWITTAPEWLLIMTDSDLATLPRITPESRGLSRVSLEALIGSQIDGQGGEIARYRALYPHGTPTDEENLWRNRVHEGVLRLQAQDVAAACGRLVVLGAPGSGKSTFVRHLALCLAGAGITDWTRPARLAHLRHWPHGALLPIYIELRHFVSSRHFPADVNTAPTADHLWAYIRHELLGDDLAGFLDDMQKDVENGAAIILLDGLDEVPYPENKLDKRQKQLIALAAVLNSPRFERSRVVVASRPYAYTGWELPGFTAVTLTAFADEQRIGLASRLSQINGLDAEQAAQKAYRLNEQLQERQIDPALQDRPLFVTMMAEVFLKGDEAGLPTRRGALYRESILLLLDRWTQGKPGAPSLMEILGEHNVNTLYQRLAALADEVHETFGEHPDTPEIAEELLYKHLQPLGRHRAADLIPYLSEHAGVLVSPGQDRQKSVFFFAHRTFQEYLSAVRMVEGCEARESYTLVRERITSKPQLWRIPAVLVGDVLADTGKRRDLWALLADLLPDDPPRADSAFEAWWAAWLAAVIAQEQGLHEQQNLHRRTEQPIREALVEWLVALIETPQALPPVERAQVGRVLSLLGDPRPNILTLPTPDDRDYWCEVPGGKFKYGGDPEAYESAEAAEIDLPTFYMGRYPITYAQFQTFIDAADGFKNVRWWQGLADEEYRRRNQRQPRGQHFQYANHPRENVSWYDAMAFCAWWSFKLTGQEVDWNAPLSWPIRLPTEQEWEKAARGMDGRIYPYANNFDPAKDNTYETGIRQTSAVGAFPDGASPYGVLDMSGNVLEWCLTDWKTGLSNNITNIYDNRRALRGGSWRFDLDFARAASRFRSLPRYRYVNLGFRVVFAAPIRFVL